MLQISYTNHQPTASNQLPLVVIRGDVMVDPVKVQMLYEMGARHENLSAFVSYDSNDSVAGLVYDHLRDSLQSIQDSEASVE